MAKATASVVGAFTLLLVVACSSSSGGDGTPDEACDSYANASCTQLKNCLPDSFGVLFTDVPSCAARVKISCTTSVNAKGTGIKTSDVTTCANAFNAASCTTLIADQQPEACRPKVGAGAPGSACQDNSQCASTYCKFGTSAACGACSARIAAGGKCTESDDCEIGLECGGTQTCVATGKAGDACSNDKPCGGGLVCKTGAAGATSGTCSAPAGAGEACTGNECDSTKALFCSQNVCKKVTFVAPGAACGFVGGNLVGCSGSGANCVITDATSGMGTCKAGIADGGPCGGAQDASCMTPARCVNSVCTLPTTCGG